nr:uncharacterized protein LOC121832207 isoform X3 [Peromyscus maniculatus bairdii]XP_042140350.1 uncharacterized protein LOC121832207 isoform X3 [Peromyscus maniculatus bairdii]
MMGQAQARTKKRDASLICWNSGKFYSNREEAKPRGCTDLCRSVLMKPRTEHGRKAVHAGQKATLDPLELELQTIVSHHEGSGNQTLGRLQEQRMLLTAEPSRWTPKQVEQAAAALFNGSLHSTHMASSVSLAPEEVPFPFTVSFSTSAS